MKMTKSLGILFLVMALVVAGISFVLGWRLGTEGYVSWIRGMDFAPIENPPIAKTEAEKRILSVLDDLYSPGG